MITRSIKESLSFAFSIKRIIPYFLFNIIIFSLILVILNNLSSFITSGQGFLRFLPSSVVYVPVFIILFLIELVIKGAIIDQAKFYPKRRSLLKSFSYSSSRFLTMLCVAILYAIILFIISSPPYIGPLLSLGVTLAFFFLYPTIIVDKNYCIDAFKKSFRTFLKYPLETFVTWIIASIISLVVVLIFALPLLLQLFSDFDSTFKTLEEINATMNVTIESIFPTFSTSLYRPEIFLSIIIFSLALSYVQVFYLGTQTRLYVNSRKIEI